MSTIEQVQTEIAEIKANVTGVEVKLDAVEAEIAEVKAKLNAAQENNEKEGYLTALSQKEAALHQTETALHQTEAALHQTEAALHQEKAALTALLPKPESPKPPLLQVPDFAACTPSSWKPDTAKSRSHIIPRFASLLSLIILPSMQSPNEFDCTFAQRFKLLIDYMSHQMTHDTNYHETFLSASLAGSFSDFIHQCVSTEIRCCHQLPVCGALGSFSCPAWVDLGFVHSLDPSSNYLYAHIDIKKNKTINAPHQSLGYSVHSRYLNSGAFIAIVCDLQSVQLSVHVFNGTSTMAVCEPLINCSWSHLDSVASFLSGFRAGLQFLHKLDKSSSLLHLHYCNSPQLPCPRLDSNRGFSFLKGFSASDLNYRIYRVSDDQRPGHDQVWKFFDGLECNHIRPNLDLVRDLLDEFAQCDSIGDHISILKYSFRQDNGGWTSKGVIGVIQRLHRLHRLCFVHGDIRKANLLLDAGYIIDFDFARPIKERPVYPDSFNSLISERHPGARPKFPMELEHDSYSLAEVLRGQGVRATICEYVKGGEFQLAIDQLSVVEEDVHITKKVRCL